MKIEQVEDIVLEIRTIYPHTTKDQSFDKMCDSYERYLINKDFDLVWSNLQKHIESSRFAPTISDLVRKPEVTFRVPNVEETKAYLEKLENKKPLSEEELAKWHKKVFDAIGVKK